MANTATALPDLPIACLGRGQVQRVVAAIDNTGADLTIIAADANKMTALVGGSSSKTSAATTLIFKAGGVEVGRLTIANGATMNEAIKDAILNAIAGAKNQAITVQSDVAVTLYLAYVQGSTLHVTAQV